MKIGAVYVERNELNSAMRHFEKARCRFEEINEVLLLSQVFSAISEALAKKGNLKKAIIYAEKGISFAYKTKVEKYIIVALRSKAKALVKFDKKRAFDTINSAFVLLTDKKMVLEEAKLYFDLAQLYFTVHETEKMEEYLNKAEVIFKKAGAKLWLKKIQRMKIK